MVTGDRTVTWLSLTGEGARPLLERPELRGAVNRRFDDAPPNTGAPNEPRVVAIIREPGQGSGEYSNCVCSVIGIFIC